MAFSEADNRFLQQANRVLEEPSRFRPHLIEDINRWSEQGLGINIYTTFDASAAPLPEKLLIGVALPIPDELRQHLVILISGDMILVKPRDQEHQALYDKHFGANITFGKARDISHISNFDNTSVGSIPILRNNTEANRDYIDNLVVVALEHARKIKELKTDSR